MGKGTLIIVLGISTILALMVVGIHANSNASLDTTIDFFKTTQARLIANSGVEIYLEKMRRNKALTGNFFNNEISGGEFDIYISGPDSALRLKSVARFGGKTHTSVVTAKRTPVTIPSVNSALYISSQNLNLSGNIDIDGNDYNMDGTPGSAPPVPGIGVDEPADSAFIINILKPKVSKAIKGYGGSPSVYTVVDNTDWEHITEDYIFAADVTLPSGVYSSGTYGTVAEPKIIYANGNISLEGSASAAGIMVVNGNLELGGSFTFKGILIAFGPSSIKTKTVGNAGIFGSAIFVGQDVDLQAAGNANIFYSNQAVVNAQNNVKSSRFSIVSWWE